MTSLVRNHEICFAKLTGKYEERIRNEAAKEREEKRSGCRKLFREVDGKAVFVGYVGPDGEIIEGV